MSETEVERLAAKATRPHDEVMAELLDPCIAKTEREWAAAEEITRLTRERDDAEEARAKGVLARIEEVGGLAERNAELLSEIRAARLEGREEAAAEADRACPECECAAHCECTRTAYQRIMDLEQS